MFDQNKFVDSPLSFEEIERIDATGLPNIDRHYLRLLAHCLSCFKGMANGSNLGFLPEEQDRLKWLLAKPALIDEREFVFALLDQLASAGLQLEKIADQCNISPLELTLQELIDFSLRASQC